MSKAKKYQLFADFGYFDDLTSIISFDVDQNASIFVEAFKKVISQLLYDLFSKSIKTKSHIANVYVAKFGDEEELEKKCVLQLPYLARFGLISLGSFEKLIRRHLPTLGIKLLIGQANINIYNFKKA